MSALTKSLGFLIFLFFLSRTVSWSQTMTKEETQNYMKTMPMFSTYKDNYFVTGIPLNKSIKSSTADVKYQISFKQMITRATLPWNTYLFVTYSQKSFWNIYKESSPFKEINFNPSIGLGKPIFNSANRLTGLATIGLVHNSNGRDSIYSRSWNRLKLDYNTLVGPKTTFSASLWLPFGYKTDNPDILDYEGIFKLGLEYDFIPDKLSTKLSFQKGLKWDLKGKFSTRIYYKPFKAKHQYLMLEWFAGYGESLLNYQDFTNMIRVGYVIKTDELDVLKPKSDTD